MAGDDSSELAEARRKLYEVGIAIRKDVTGPEHVARSTQNANSFTKPIQDLATEVGWGAIWSRPGLSRKQRSLLNLAMLTAMGKSHELGVHVRGAIRNGCSELEIRETLLHASGYAGLPAGLEGFRVADRVLEEMEEKGELVRAKL